MNGDDVSVHQGDARDILGVREFAVANWALALGDLDKIDVNGWSFSHIEGWSGSRRGPLVLVGSLTGLKGYDDNLLRVWGSP